MKTLANNKLGTTATDVDDKSLPAGLRQAVGNTQMNQARFFNTGYHFDTVSECFLCLIDKSVAGLGNTQGIGADCTNIAGLQVVYALAKAPQTVECALGDVGMQLLMVIKSGCKPYRFTQPVNDLELAILQTANNHVKAV